jgi:hypothetical protein
MEKRAARNQPGQKSPAIFRHARQFSIDDL